MKTNIQIKILELIRHFAVYGPFSATNNKEYKALGWHFEKVPERHWILPNGATAQFKISELFGQASPSVIVSVTPKDLVACGSQLQIGGYVAAEWDDRHNCVRLMEGVELVCGAWDVAASTAGKTPCLTGADAVLHIVVHRAFATTHGLKIVEELPEEPNTNSPARCTDSELKAELVRRGYRVEMNS